MNNKVIQLTDGRRLAYMECGPMDGFPVIAFHGAPGSRLERITGDSALRETNTRLIVVERPGYGLSDFHESRTLLDWPDDVTCLADTLRLDCFSLLGFSGGGTYAAACAYRIPERLIHTALISSAAPFTVPGLSDAMPPANRALFELAGEDYQAAVQQLAGVANTPDALFNLLEGSASPPDRDILATPEFRRMYADNLTESLRQGLTGLSHDMALIARPWGFDPAEIRANISVWHGTQDNNTPLAMGEYLGATIPACRTHFFADAGHFLAFTHGRKILQTLNAG